MTDGQSRRTNGSSRRMNDSSRRTNDSSRRTNDSSRRTNGSSHRMNDSTRRTNGSSHWMNGSSCRMNDSSRRTNGSSRRMNDSSSRMNDSSCWMGFVSNGNFVILIIPAVGVCLLQTPTIGCVYSRLTLSEIVHQGSPEKHKSLIYNLSELLIGVAFLNKISLTVKSNRLQNLNNLIS